jgi:hypothetical protein
MALQAQRFSQLYLERGEPTRDSVRFRHRLGAYFDERVHKDYRHKCREVFEREVGAKVPFDGATWSFASLFKSGELRDVLDAITVIHDVLVEQRSAFSRAWRDFVARAMHEENVGYRVDESCVVHFHVDQEFERNRIATVVLLDLPQFGAVRASFEDSYRHLDSQSRDTKAAVRSIFEAVETMAKLIVPGADRLVRNLCVQKLKDACLAVAGGDSTEQQVLSDMFTSLGYWVEAVHDYRHGQRVHDPVAPTEETAVLILSTGSAFLRQLALYASRMPLLPLTARVGSQ